MSSDTIFVVVGWTIVIIGIGVVGPALICWRKNKKGLAVLGALIFLSVIQSLFGDDPSGGTGNALILVLASPVVYAGAIRPQKR